MRSAFYIASNSFLCDLLLWINGISKPMAASFYLDWNDPESYRCLTHTVSRFPKLLVISGGTSITNFATSLVLTNNNGVPLKSSK